jgi:hypothetical protein
VARFLDQQISTRRSSHFSTLTADSSTIMVFPEAAF